jgi:transcription antitermination protein NusB
MANKYDVAARKQARYKALQTIYEWQFSASPIADILARQLARKVEKKFDKNYFIKIVEGVVDNTVEIDHAFLPFLDRKIDELSLVERAVLRIATYELLYCQDVPFKVSINEALELTKLFGSDEGFKYVNGVLDKVAKAIKT